MNRIVVTSTYDDEVSKWPMSYQDAAKKLEHELVKNSRKGRPLGLGLRESRIREKRVYYLVFEQYNLILLIAASGKKKQQHVIRSIWYNIENYRQRAEEIFNGLS